MAKRPTRSCPVPMCGATVKSPYLMCTACWRRVPLKERRAFYKEMRSGSAGAYWRAVENVIKLSAEAR